MIDKPALRRALRVARDGFVAAHRPSPPAPPPALRDRLRPGAIVASYVPVGSETDPCRLDEAARAAGCRVALPYVVDRATPLRFLDWPEGAPLIEGPFGLSNPHPEWEEVTPAIVVTPLIGFDRALNRLGQGAAFYDRAFAAHPAAWRMGLAWSVQQVDALPTDRWDMPLQAVATERDWWTR